MKRILLAALLVLAVLASVVVARAFTGTPRFAPTSAATIALDVPEAEVVDRFAEALRFQTISHGEDSGEALDAKNFRLLFSDTIAGVEEHVRRVIDDPEISIEAVGLRKEPSDVSLPGTPAWELLTRTIRQTYGDVAIAPLLIPGGTDARYFRGLSEGVFGFSPVSLEVGDMRRAHGIDERVPVASLEAGVRFYAQLLTNAATP